MKDGYSFHTDEDSLQTCTRYATHAGSGFRAVDADPGAIGSGSQEFMCWQTLGKMKLYTEDGHAANVEKVSLYHQLNHLSLQTMKTETPGCDD